MTIRDPNAEMLRAVARAFGDLREQVMFLGGATTGILITDLAATAIRPTKDVDVVVEAASRASYLTNIMPTLRQLGFHEDTSEGAPICRWLVDGIKVDVMPTQGAILGFSNRWYSAAIAAATRHWLDDNLEIQLITAPYFLATKLEAFRDRGDGDYQLSHDLEDFIAVVDGRPELLSEIEAITSDLREYLADGTRALLSAREFRASLPGHLPGHSAAQARLGDVIRRLERIAR